MSVNSDIEDLHFASAHGQLDRVKACLKKGVDINVKNADGRTALIWASNSGQENVVQFLLDQRGLHIDDATKTGHTALILASTSGHYNIVDRLIEKKADVMK